MSKSDFGIIGLGVMGSNLSLNIAENGIDISVYNRAEGNEAEIVNNFIAQNKNTGNIKGFTSLDTFVESLKKPRKILIMIKAGAAIDSVVSVLKDKLSEDDILIDGGNSFYMDTAKRIRSLEKNKIHFIGCGISGGAEGARHGPSLMPSGNAKAFNIIEPILNKISARDKNGNPCCTFIGREGSGHFVKMIHNGIEYAEMQLLAELFALLKLQYTNTQIADIFESWNENDLHSFLLEITIQILRTKENQSFLIDKILDKSGSKGTGFWSVREGLQMGLATTMMSAALYARYISSKKHLRRTLSQQIENDRPTKAKLNLKNLENAYRFARIINHHQGFSLIQTKSDTEAWNLNVSEIARIWTNGCIIRSKLMEELANNVYNENQNFGLQNFFEQLAVDEKSVVDLIQLSLKNRIAVDCFWAAYNYWISMTTDNLPANLIQAQRDYFGGHTFERIDKDAGQFFTHKWKSDA